MKNIIISLLVTFFTLHSCDVLDLKPLDSLSEQDIWQDPNLIQLYVNSCYDAVYHGFSGDDILAGICGETYPIRDSGGAKQILQAGLTSGNVNGSITGRLNFWDRGYSYLRKINLFFDKMENVSLGKEVEEMIGEMKFLRAFIYSTLINRYGGVPIITKVYQLDEEFGMPRDSYEKCVEFIVNELNEAIHLLPDQQPEESLGRASADACRALKARQLLYAASPFNNPNNDKNKWQDAADAAEELIDTRYELYPDYQNLFLAHNSEIIFARYFTQASNCDFYVWMGRSESGGHGAQNPTQNIVNAYEMKATGKLPYIQIEDGSYVLNAESGYDPQNPYVGRDPRFYASILYDGSIWAGRETETFEGGADSPQGSNFSWNATKTSYYLKKFIPEELPPIGATEHMTSPWIFFRYAEVLLNYAEAKFELGDEETCRKMLNKVRSRQSVNMPEITDTGEALRKRIRNERRIELAFEEHRYFDVRRWNIAEQTENEPLYSMKITKEYGIKKYTEEPLMERKFDRKLYLIPISITEIQKDKQLQQNPGY